MCTTPITKTFSCKCKSSACWCAPLFTITTTFSMFEKHFALVSKCAQNKLYVLAVAIFSEKRQFQKFLFYHEDRRTWHPIEHQPQRQQQFIFVIVQFIFLPLYIQVEAFKGNVLHVLQLVKFHSIKEMVFEYNSAPCTLSRRTKRFRRCLMFLFYLIWCSVLACCRKLQLFKLLIEYIKNSICS